jgi:hypothetical protein
MAIKGITTMLRFNDRTYAIGEPLEGLPNDEEASLVASGLAEYCDDTDEEEKAEFDPLLSMSAATIKEALKGIEDSEKLDSLMDEEMAVRNRKTVITAIKERLAELAEKKDGDTNEEDNGSTDEEDEANENSGAADHVDLNFDPSDAVVEE